MVKKKKEWLRRRSRRVRKEKRETVKLCTRKVKRTEELLGWEEVLRRGV